MSRYVNSKLPNRLFVHLNIQSLQAKYDNLITFLNSVADCNEHALPSVIALSETWLNPSNESLFDINGYHSLIARSRLDHSNRGRVGVYVRSDLHVVQARDHSTLFSNIYTVFQRFPSQFELLI